MNTLRDAGYLKIGLVGLDAGKHDEAACCRVVASKAMTTARDSTFDATFHREPPRGDLPRWIVAAVVVVALHVGLGALLIYRQAPEPRTDANDAVLVELAPIDAPAPPAQEVAPAPTQEEKAAAAPPPPPPEPAPPAPAPPEAVEPPPPPPPPEVAPAPAAAVAASARA